MKSQNVTQSLARVCARSSPMFSFSFSVVSKHFYFLPVSKKLPLNSAFYFILSWSSFTKGAFMLSQWSTDTVDARNSIGPHTDWICETRYYWKKHQLNKLFQGYLLNHCSRCYPKHCENSVTQVLRFLWAPDQRPRSKSSTVVSQSARASQ